MKIKVCNRILFFLCAAALFLTGICKKTEQVETAYLESEVIEENSVENINEQDEDKTVESKSTFAEENQVRVLVKSQNFEHYYHESVNLICNSDTTTDKKGVTFGAGEGLQLDKENSIIGMGESITLIPGDETKGFTLLSIERDQGNPTYEGSITLYRIEEGFQIVNNVSLETYLCYVVPSEMPSNYHRQALAAQAVCARTYVWTKMSENGIEGGKADVDDSVMYQVYNNIDRTASADAAVLDTKGIIMTCEGIPITAYFFSTSSGRTSTNEVWAQEPVEYLQCVSTGNLEESDPWYKWQVSFTMQELSQRAEEYKIGQLQNMEILDTSDGGAAISLKLVGTQGEHVLDGELKIRQFFWTEGISIHRHDGSEVKDMDFLPSAYISLECKDDDEGIKICLIRGGGYGHGVGMSQNAANHLAEQGRTWSEILHYFYRKIDLDSIL